MTALVVALLVIGEHVAGYRLHGKEALYAALAAVIAVLFDLSVMSALWARAK
jgi:hypothetical protein